MPALGIIPAHAGLTAYSISFAHCARDHSRVCGAHSGSGLYLTHFGGSSPRMRGSLHDFAVSKRIGGIIPAYAGLTRTRALTIRARRDHPRVCGAHASPARILSVYMESSPRMRGSRINISRSDTLFGIIPAYAGLTQSNRCSKTTAWDHPRACGAHGAVSGAGEPPVGSSPRMRDSHITKRLVAILRGSSPRMRGSPAAI